MNAIDMMHELDNVTDNIIGDKNLQSLAILYQHFERTLIIKTLSNCNGNRTKAANRLGMGRTTLAMRLKKYGIKSIPQEV